MLVKEPTHEMTQPNRSGRNQAQLKAARNPIVLTDNYAPIDRLIGAESY